MANRAYLFFIGTKPYTEGNHDEFFDSRHNVPFAWFLFFGVQDLDKRVSEYDRNIPPTPDAYLIRPWGTARDVFLQRISRVLPFFGNRLTHQDVENFLTDLDRYSKTYLVMDPYQIDEYDSEQIWRSTLADIEATDNNAHQQYATVASLAHISEQMSREELILNVFGYNYS